MKKLNKVAMLFASAALAMPMAAFAQAKSNDNWRAADGTVWKNGYSEGVTGFGETTFAIDESRLETPTGRIEVAEQIIAVAN